MGKRYIVKFRGNKKPVRTFKNKIAAQKFARDLRKSGPLKVETKVRQRRRRK